MNRFIIGFLNGLVQVYETKNDESSKCLWVKLLHEFDLNKKVQKFIKKEDSERSPAIPTFEIISSEPVWKQQHNFLQKQFETQKDTEEEIEDVYSIKINFFQKNESNYILICSRKVAIDINLSSFEIEKVYNISNVTKDCQDFFHSFSCRTVNHCTTRLVASSAFFATFVCFRY